MLYPVNINIFYKKTVDILGLRKMKEFDFLNIFDRNSKKHNIFLSQGCKFSQPDYYIESKNKFYPLCEQINSCSYLVMSDSIHLYLAELSSKIFEDIITVKEGTNSSSYRINVLANKALEKLVNPSKYTKYTVNFAKLKSPLQSQHKPAFA